MSLQGHIYQKSLVIGAASTFVGLVYFVPKVLFYVLFLKKFRHFKYHGYNIDMVFAIVMNPNLSF